MYNLHTINKTRFLTIS